MNLTEYIRLIADKIDKELSENNHAEVIRLVRVLRDTLNIKITEWEKIL